MRGEPPTVTPVSPPRPVKPVSDLAMPDAVAQVLARWESIGALSPQTQLRSAETLNRFATRLHRTRVDLVQDITPRDCEQFLDARTRYGTEPELATRHGRRVVLRLFFRTLRDLGYSAGDPTLDLRLPPRTNRPSRPLTDDEVLLCRVATRLGRAGSGSLFRAVVWALAETTAISSEISTLRVDDLNSVKNPRWVRLPGTRRHLARDGELTDWGTAIISRHLAALTAEHHPGTTLLAYRGSAEPGQHTAQASTCNAIRAVLDATGLAQEPDVRPASVRNWAGRRLLDQGLSLEVVARRMGHRRLDTAAEDLALGW